MSRKGTIIVALLAVLASVAALALWKAVPQTLHVATWQSMASPGPLSSAHAFLQEDCAACHTPVKGVQDATQSLPEVECIEIGSSSAWRGVWMVETPGKQPSIQPARFRFFHLLPVAVAGVEQHEFRLSLEP